MKGYLRKVQVSETACYCVMIKYISFSYFLLQYVPTACMHLNYFIEYNIQNSLVSSTIYSDT